MTPPKRLFPKVLTNAEADARGGTFYSAEELLHVIREDCDAYCQNTGAMLFKFRKRYYDEAIIKQGYEALKGAIAANSNRQTASGNKAVRRRADGTESKIIQGDPVESSIAGYFDRSGMHPHCRQTAFTKHHFDKFQQAIPFVKMVDEAYEHFCPKHHREQAKKAKATNRNYVIQDTCFTTITINRNYQTAIHKDAGDFTGGMGNLTVCEIGEYEGGIFCLPQWAVGIDIRMGDALFVDVHQWHGNTPVIIKGDPDPRKNARVSFVIYYRDDMISCLQPSEELRRAKRMKTEHLFKNM